MVIWTKPRRRKPHQQCQQETSNYPRQKKPPAEAHTRSPFLQELAGTRCFPFPSSSLSLARNVNYSSPAKLNLPRAGLEYDANKSLDMVNKNTATAAYVWAMNSWRCLYMVRRGLLLGQEKESSEWQMLRPAIKNIRLRTPASFVRLSRSASQGAVNQNET